MVERGHGLQSPLHRPCRPGIGGAGVVVQVACHPGVPRIEESETVMAARSLGPRLVGMAGSEATGKHEIKFLGEVPKLIASQGDS